MKQQLKQISAVLMTALFLSACGGGGGSTPAPTSVTKSVSGTINLSSGVAAAKAAAGADLPVQISSYNSAGVLLSGGSVAATTSSSGKFSARVPLIAGGYVLVDVVKDGYAEFHRRIDFKDTVDDMDILGTVDKTTTAIQKIATYSNLSTVGIKAVNQIFSFAVMRFPDGVKKAVAGSEIKAAKANGATTEMGISIPADTLQGVSSLKADLNTYEPALDSAKFPGSYTADYKGQQGKMVSLAFDYLKITDAASGESLGSVAQKLVKAGVQKAAVAATVYTRWIPTSSCDTLFQYDDFDATTPGFQVPVWSLNPNSGKWELIGIGTIYDSADAVSPSATPTAPACASSGNYLKITISNEAFLKFWWNLDHIVLTPLLKKVCINGTITNGDASMYVNLYGKGFESSYVKVGSDGKYSLEMALLNAKETNRAATLSYTDNFGNYNSAEVTMGDFPTCTTKNFTLVAPGTVSGTIKNDTGAVAYKAVQLRGTTTNRWVYTDSNGVFTSTVKKGEDISVYLGYNASSSGTFRINGVTTDYTLEKTDDGSAVVLNDITVTNQAPMANVSLSSYSIKVGKTVTAYLYTSDEEGDYPIAYILKSGSTTMASGSIASGASSATVNLTPAAGSYPLTLTVTDSKSNSRDVTVGTLEVAAGNRAPVVSLYANRSYIPSNDATKQVTLYGYANDNDGDSLSYTWKVNGTTVKSGTGQNGYANDSYLFTVPQAANVEDVFTVVFEVSDGTVTVSRTTNLTYGLNHAPTVYVSADKTFVVSGASGTARDVTCTATGYDLDGDTLTYRWAVDSVQQSSATAAVFTYTIPTAATIGQSFDIKVTVSDGAKSSTASCKASYGQAGDVTVVIQ